LTRGKNFGILRSMDNLGAVTGIVLCIVLFPIIGYKNLFILAAIPSLIGASLIFFKLKEETVKTKAYKSYSLKSFDKNLKILFFVSILFSLGNFSYSFLLVFAYEFKFPFYSTPVLYLIFTAIASLLSYSFGKLSDIKGRKNILFVSLLFWMSSLLILLVNQNLVAIILAFVLYGFHKAAFEPVHKAFVSELSPSEMRASVIGGFQMMMGIFAFPSSLIAGILWESINIFAPFYFSLFLTCVATLLILKIKQVEGKNEKVEFS